jgi:hypothetical protein
VDDAAVARRTLDFIEARRGRLLLHAGGAADTSGRTVVVHGESGAGKTTLTTALVAQGLAYVSDETICLDPQSLQIEAFRKPLTVKPGSQNVLAALKPPKREVSADSGNWQIPPERLGGPDLPDAPLHPAVIVFPDYDDAHAGIDITPVSRARAAFVLGEQSSAMWAIEPRPLAAVARLVEQAPAFQVSYSDAFAAAPVIVGELLNSAAPTPADDPVSEAKQPVPQASTGPRRADNVDWLILDGEAVLFDGDHLHHLDVPGAAVWSALDGEQALADVAFALATTFGAEPDTVLLDVEDLVRVFRTRGLVS